MSITFGDEDDIFDLERLNEIYFIEELSSPDFDVPDLFGPDLPEIDDSAEACEAFLNLLNDYDEEHEPLSVPAPFVDVPLSTEFPDLLAADRIAEHEIPPPLSLAVPQPQPLLANPGSLHPDSIENIIPDGGLPALALGLSLAADSAQQSSGSPVTAAQGHAAPIARPVGRPRLHARKEARSPASPISSPSRSSLSQHRAGRAAAGAAASAAGRRPPKLRYSKGAAPSKYCHVCGRSSKTVSVALCGNNTVGLCRKVVCDKCLLMHQRDSWELAKQPGSQWICMHCKSECPDRARCHQYQRNNMKRRLNGTGEFGAATAGAGSANVARKSNGNSVLRPGRPAKTLKMARGVKGEKKTARVEMGQDSLEKVIEQEEVKEGNAQPGGAGGEEGFEDISPVNIIQSSGAIRGDDVEELEWKPNSTMDNHGSAQNSVGQQQLMDM